MRLLFVIVFFVTTAWGIVPIKPREVGENPGTSGEIAVALQTKRGNTDKDNYTLSLKMKYDSNTSWLAWGMLRGEYGEALGERNVNNVFSHFRYIQNLTGNFLAFELFAQIQADEFKSIKNRSLGGGGLRWKAAREDSEWGGAFLGLGAFYEYVGYATEADPLERNVRINAYLAYTFTFEQAGLFTVVGYFQPKIDDFSDYLAIVAANVEVSVYKQLYVSFYISYEYDAVPAVDVKKEDFTQQTLIKYKF